MKGFFIALEGIEGTGKSTQARLLAEYLAGKGFAVLQTAEPGGTKIGQKIRELLLSVESSNMDQITELLLYNASRIQHLKEVITPSLDRGDSVVTDRFSDSTVAYQGYGRGIDLRLIHDLDIIATGGLKPDLTIILDMDVETGLRRNREINKNDRLELEDITFHIRVRDGFIRIAAQEPDRVKLIDCSDTIEKVQGKIKGVVEEFIGRRGLI